MNFQKKCNMVIETLQNQEESIASILAEFFSSTLETVNDTFHNSTKQYSNSIFAKLAYESEMNNLDRLLIQAHKIKTYFQENSIYSAEIAPLCEELKENCQNERFATIYKIREMEKSYGCKLIVIVGNKETGKTTMLESIIKAKPDDFARVKRTTTRSKHLYEQGELIANQPIEKVNKCDFHYQSSFSNCSYGFNYKDIEDIFAQSKSPLLIINDYETLNILKRSFPTKILPIYLHRRQDEITLPLDYTQKQAENLDEMIKLNYERNPHLNYWEKFQDLFDDRIITLGNITEQRKFKFLDSIFGKKFESNEEMVKNLLNICRREKVHFSGFYDIPFDYKVNHFYSLSSLRSHHPVVQRSLCDFYQPSTIIPKFNHYSRQNVARKSSQSRVQ